MKDAILLQPQSTEQQQPSSSQQCAWVRSHQTTAAADATLPAADVDALKRDLAASEATIADLKRQLAEKTDAAHGAVGERSCGQRSQR